MKNYIEIAKLGPIKTLKRTGSTLVVNSVEYIYTHVKVAQEVQKRLKYLMIRQGI